jgi:long-chain acyl-CoA synthetase
VENGPQPAPAAGHRNIPEETHVTLQPATLTALFADWAAKYADLPALSRKVDGVFTPITYAELDRRASRLALALARELGVEKGELVALVCNNRLEWMVCSLAIHMLGAVDVPRASDTPPDILAAILGHAQPAVAILENTAQLEKARGSLPRLRAAVLVDAPQEATKPDGDACVICTLDDLLARGESAWADGGAEEVERRRAAVAPEDLATVIYTSGTTGTPKGVALSHANYLLNIREIPKLMGTERELVLSILQPWHAYERQVQLICLSMGCCLHYGSVLTLRSDLRAVRPAAMTTVPELWVTLYKGVFQKIDAETPAKRRLARWLIACSLSSAAARRVLSGREPVGRPPGAAGRAVRYAWALVSAGALAPFHALADRLVFREVRAGLGGRMRFPLVGGGPLPDAVDEFFDAARLPLLEGYGMTEAIVVMALREPRHRVLKTTGHVIRGMEHRLVREDGRACGSGESGRLLVRGPNIMLGYYKDPERTAEVLGADGWLDTGDLARVHADGSLRVLGRLDDTVVLTSGKNVNAPYLENELRASEWIERAVVIGAGRPYVTAFIAPSRSHLEGLGRSLGLPPAEPSTLIEDERVLEHYRDLATRISADARRFESYERVQRVRLWLEEFRIGCELSQTLKLRRQEFSRLYAREIDELYEDRST